MLSLEDVLAESGRWTSVEDDCVRWTTSLHRSSRPVVLRQQQLAQAGQEKAKNDLRFLALRIAGVVQEVSGILVSWHRIDWMQSLLREKHIREDAFRLYVASDIDQFHVRMRSALDYLATLVWGAASDPGKIKKFRSFRALVEWIRKNPDKHEHLGPLADDAARASEWFYGLRKIRDMTVHEGGFTLVFPIEEVIGFMVLQPGSGFRVPESVLPTEVMYNENVVNFRKYAAVHLCWLLSLGETIVGRLLSRWNTGVDPGIHASGGGVDMLNVWVSSF